MTQITILKSLNLKQSMTIQINYDVLKKLGSECDATIDRIRRDTETETTDIKPRQRWVRNKEHQISRAS